MTSKNSQLICFNATFLWKKCSQQTLHLTAFFFVCQTKKVEQADCHDRSLSWPLEGRFQKLLGLFRKPSYMKHETQLQIWITLLATNPFKMYIYIHNTNMYLYIYMTYINYPCIYIYYFSESTRLKDPKKNNQSTWIYILAIPNCSNYRSCSQGPNKTTVTWGDLQGNQSNGGSCGIPPWPLAHHLYPT